MFNGAPMLGIMYSDLFKYCSNNHNPHFIDAETNVIWNKYNIGFKHISWKS